MGFQKQSRAWENLESHMYTQAKYILEIILDDIKLSCWPTEHRQSAKTEKDDWIFLFVEFAHLLFSVLFSLLSLFYYLKFLKLNVLE